MAPGNEFVIVHGVSIDKPQERKKRIDMDGSAAGPSGDGIIFILFAHNDIKFVHVFAPQLARFTPRACSASRPTQYMLMAGRRDAVCAPARAD